MEALGRLVRNAAGAFVRHTPRRDSPPPSDSGSGSDGDPSSPDDSSGDDDDSARGDDPPNGTFGRRPLRISLYNPLFHSGSDGRPIKGALRNPGGVKVEEPASPNATSTREPSRGGAAEPHRRALLCVYGRRTGGGFMGSGPSTSPMYAFPRVGTHDVDARPIEPTDADLAAELRRVASPPVTAELIRDRERGVARRRRRQLCDRSSDKNAFTMNAPTKLSRARVANAAVGSRYVPCRNPKLVDALGSRAYCGRFSRSGDVFVAACQDRRVYVYDTSDDAWGVRGVVNARALRWTVTDCAVSPDESRLFYASITPYVHLARVPGSTLDGSATSGGTRTPHDSTPHDSTPHDPTPHDFTSHESLEIGRGFASPGLERDGVFGIWSCRWSSDGTRLLCGTSDAAACVHDVERDVTVARHKAHDGDVNAVAWANGGDGGDARVYFTGSDDCVVKAWDARMAPRVPVGVFLGHTEGVCHVDSRDDGRHLLSNGKDQTVRVWDLRRAWSNEDAAAWCRRRPIPVWSWDYRFMAYPASGWDFDMGRFEGTADEETTFRARRALQTLRGHRVDQTLIRAYFSPLAHTGGRYVYSGSGDGAVCFWDLQTGELVAKTSGLFSAAPHSVIGPALRRVRRGEYPANEASLRRGALVRDCAWHPVKPRLVSVAWDGAIVQWDADEDAGVERGCDSSEEEDRAVAGSDGDDEGG